MELRRGGRRSGSKPGRRRIPDGKQRWGGRGTELVLLVRGAGSPRGTLASEHLLVLLCPFSLFGFVYFIRNGL